MVGPFPVRRDIGGERRDGRARPTGIRGRLPPLPPEIASHVAAVVLFGKPSDHFMRQVGAPPITLGPLYTPKTAEYCVPGDTVCDGSPFPGQPNPLHVLYSFNGMTLAAADFAANRL
ncbi:cutinase family protein [Nocardia macrotermitis]|uniref:Cutinase n=1 Tax=Nocardia macrotermitis TaxID=2585198 RepID=A0A7K0DF31_9NOCA|nr:hypothetical protein [Nocardia macrotermitis]